MGHVMPFSMAMLNNQRVPWFAKTNNGVWLREGSVHQVLPGPHMPEIFCWNPIPNISLAMQQEAIHWRYLPFQFHSIYKAYVSENIPTIHMAKHMVRLRSSILVSWHSHWISPNIKPYFRDPLGIGTQKTWHCSKANGETGSIFDKPTF